MKKQMLNTLLAAGVLLCGSTKSALAHDSNPVARHAQILACLASEMENEFREDLQEMHRHYGPSRAERGFMAALCQLSGVANQFRRTVDQHAPACELERGFAAMQNAFECVEDSTDDVRVCGSIREKMARFESTLDCLEDVGFEIAHNHREPEPSHGGHHHHGGGGSDRGSIGFRIPLPPGLPFVFREPMR